MERLDHWETEDKKEPRLDVAFLTQTSLSCKCSHSPRPHSDNFKFVSALTICQEHVHTHTHHCFLEATDYMVFATSVVKGPVCKI